jgi:hypothetical protein
MYSPKFWTKDRYKFILSSMTIRLDLEP